MAGSNPELTANSPKSPLSNPNPNPKQAWKQRSAAENLVPAAVVRVPEIEVGGGPESWPALSESTGKVVKPTVKDGSAASDALPALSAQQTVLSPSKSTPPPNPNFTPAQPQPLNPRPKPLKRTPNPNPNFTPNPNPESSSPVLPSPVPLQSTPPSETSIKDLPNQRRSNYQGPNKWRANNNNGRRNNEGFYEGFYQKGQGQPRGMRPQYMRAQAPLAAPGAPAQHGPPYMGGPPAQQARPSFAGPIPFPEMGGPVFYYAAPPMEAMRGWSPFVTSPVNSPPAIMFPQLDPQRISLLLQIDFYFSPENLCKDIYLRRNMDEQGWVPISLIAGFNKVKQMTNNVPFILETLQLSAVVEVQGDKIRRRNDWQQWLLSPEQKSTFSLPQNQSLTARFQNINLDQNSNVNSSPSLSRSSTSGDLTDQVHLGGPGPLVHGGPGPVIGPMDTSRVLIRSDTM